MKKLLLFFLFSVIISLKIAFSQTIINESFSGTFFPADWTIQSKESGEQTWLFQSDYSDVEVYESKTAMQDEWLITPSMDLSSSKSVDLNFEMWLFGVNSFITANTCDVKIKVSSNNGASWTEIWNDNQIPASEFTGDFNYGKKRTVSLDAYCGSGMNNVKIGFQYTSIGAGASATAFAAMINVNVLEKESIYKMPLEVTAGELATLLPQTVRDTLTYLALTGTIDARDFKTMRDLMPVLAEIDLSGATVVEYNGTGGTNGNSTFMTFNKANTIPHRSFSANPPYSFSAKTSLTSIILPLSVNTIQSEAFSGCYNLKSINLHSSISTINNYAFFGCTGLENIQILSSLNYIGTNAFTNINAPINVDENNFVYSSLDGVLYNKPKTELIQCPISKTGVFDIPVTVRKIGTRAFYYCNSLTTINIPNSVLELANGDIWNCGAFYACSGLTTINIPASITKIGRETFAECVNISSIYVNSASPVDLSSSPEVFTNIDKLNAKLYVPAGTKTAYQAADQWKDFQNIIETEGTGTSKTVNLTTAGTLSTILTSSELASITRLTVTGNIDARDFKTMRDLMPVLADIDLSGANIVEYIGTEGTFGADYFAYPENQIPINAFYRGLTLRGKLSLISCSLPSTATSIGSSAFSNCLNLSEIIIPSSITSIAGGAFSFCEKLISINIPSSVTDIATQTFYFCSASFIVDAENPNYSSVDGVLFDKSKTTIIQCPTSKAGVYTIPSSVTNLGVNAFSGCSSLSEIIVPPLVKEMGYQTFSNCSGLVKINIPNSVHTIQPYAFEFCRKLSSITIPSSVAQIGGAAFRGCIELASIYALKATPVNLSYSSDIFKDVDKATCILYVPAGSENLYASANQWSEFLNIQSVPVVSKTINLTSSGTLATLLTDTELKSINNLTLTGTIDARDFKTMRDLMPALAKLDLSGAVIAEYTGTEGTAGSQLSTYPAHEVPRNAFYNKTSLTSMSIPLLAKTIGRSAFNNCDGLTQVNFGANSQLTTVGYLSFAYCDNLVEIQIPSGVTLIDYGAFRQCPALVTCNLPESVKSIGNVAFYQCYKLKNCSIPQAVETIGEFAFYSCKEILNFNIPAFTVSIGRGTFIGATGTVMVAENNPSYSSLDGVFYDKNKTQLIYCPPSTTGHFTIPATVNTIAVDAFYRCSQITSFDLPEGLTTLEDWAFENCFGIASFTLPASLISIGNQSFYGCTGLTSLIVNNPVPVDLSSKTDVFLGIDRSSCKLYVPVGSESLYAAAAQWNEFTQIVASNRVPVANAGTDQTVNEGTLVTLDGTGSSDLDNNALTYIWSAPEGITLNSVMSANPTFLSPEVLTDTEFVFSLKVNNGTFNSLEDQVVVTVKQVNKAPIAHSGKNQIVEEGASVSLDGSDSYDPDYDVLQYVWIAPQGVALSSETVVNPTFLAPEVTQDTTLVFIFYVSDGILNSEAQQVVVEVKNVNKLPVAVAGLPQTVNEGIMVTLDGSQSTDADADSLTYHWTAPAGIILSSEISVNPTFTAPEITQDTQFTFSLTVDDGKATSSADQVVVTVKQVNKQPLANAGTNQTVNEGVMVTLDGSGSTDADGDGLTYQWTASAGIIMNSTTSANPTFTAPKVNEDTYFTFTLKVNDGKTSSTSSQVIVLVKQVSPTISLISEVNDVIIPVAELSYQFFQKEGDSYAEKKIQPVVEGDYARFDLVQGEWIILVSPTGNTAAFMPTYVGNAMTWADAEVLSVPEEGTISRTVTCSFPESINTGNGEISGYIYEKEGSGTKSVSIIQNPAENDIPAVGALVRLYKKGESTSASFCFTDSNGFYQFEQLKIADYEIVVELPGFIQSEKLPVTLSEVAPTTIVYIAVNTTTKIITDHSRLIDLSSLKIYPNPVTDLLTIDLGQSEVGEIQISVFNMLGDLIMQRELSGNKQVFDMTGIVPGQYLLKLKMGETIQTCVILKK